MAADDRAVRSRRFDGGSTLSLVESLLSYAALRRRWSAWELVEGRGRLAVALEGEPVAAHEPLAVYEALERYAPVHLELHVYGVVPEALAAVRTVLALGDRAQALEVLERVGWHYTRQEAVSMKGRT